MDRAGAQLAQVLNPHVIGASLKEKVNPKTASPNACAPCLWRVTPAARRRYMLKIL